MCRMCQRRAVTNRGYKEPSARGDFGVWLLESLGDKSFEQLAVDMAERGHAHTAAYYRGMASGSKKPGRVIRLALEDYFGSKTAAAQPTASGDIGQLVAAIDRLVAELALTRREQARWNKGVEDALAEIRLGREPGVPTGDREAQPLAVAPR